MRSRLTPKRISQTDFDTRFKSSINQRLFRDLKVNCQNKLSNEVQHLVKKKFRKSTFFCNLKRLLRGDKSPRGVLFSFEVGNFRFLRPFAVAEKMVFLS